jgi:hypothetical protein
MGNAFRKWIEEQEDNREHKKQKQKESRTEKPSSVHSTGFQQMPLNLKDETQSRFNSIYPMLNYHNRIRTQNGLPVLQWDHNLATKAEEWGQWLKENEKCKIRHPTSSKQELKKYLPDNMGQNLYMGFVSPTNPIENWARNAATGWYNECQFYDSKLMDENGVPKNFSGDEDQVGHFTQMMWKPTKKVGCAHIEFDQNCNNSMFRNNEGKGQIIVCNYDKGNVAGKFEENVIYNKAKCSTTNEWLK